MEVVAEPCPTKHASSSRSLSHSPSTVTRHPRSHCRGAATYDGGPTPGWSTGRGRGGIKVDAEGNTLVLGETFAGSQSGILSKYRPAGQLIWSRRNDDAASAFAVLALAHGRSTVHTSYRSFGYDSAGTLTFSVTHLFDEWFEARAAASTSGGGFCLAGTAIGEYRNYDMSVACFDPAGRPLWMRRWNGSANLRDEAESIGVDAAGRVYVTGLSQGFIKEKRDWVTHVTAAYDSAGNLLWANHVDHPYDVAPAGFAVDPAGGVVLAVPYSPSTLTIRYDAAGSPVWSRLFGDSYAFGNASPVSAAFAGDGACYVTGTTSNTGGPFLVRYGPAGEEEWFRTAAGVAGAFNLGFGVGASGQAILSWGLPTGPIRSLAFGASGAELWSTDFTWDRHFPSEPASRRVEGVAVEASGAVRVAASTGQIPGGLLTLAYDPGGAPQWRAEPLPLAAAEAAVASRLDPAGDVVVLGSGFVDGQRVFRTLKYDPSGRLLWARVAFGSAYLTTPQALSVGPSGEVAAAGYSEGSLAVVKYDGAGTELWRHSFAAPGYSGAGAEAAVD